MKKYIVYVTVMLLMVYVSYGQSQHMHHGYESDKSTHKTMGKMILKAQKDGLSIEVYLNDINAALKNMENNSAMKIDASKRNSDITHHISVFIKANDAGTIKSVTLDIKSKNFSKKYMLFHMKNHYGSDVSLKSKGKYDAILTFDIEKKKGLQFNFAFTI